MKHLRLILFSIVAFSLSGCLSPREDHTRFYVLSVPQASQASHVVEKGKAFSIGLRVTSVEYLHARQMLIEQGANQVKLSEDNVWAELPQAGFARVLASRFAENLPDGQLTTLPSVTSVPPELVLEIELRSMQGRFKPTNEAEISAEIRILDSKMNLLERHNLRRTAPWNSTPDTDIFPGLAAAESAAAVQLSDAIVDKIRECQRRISPQ